MVSTLRCGRSNPGSNPGHGSMQVLFRHGNTFLSPACGPFWPLKRGVLRRPGIEPGSTAWKAAMLTIIPPTLFLPVQGWVPGLGLARTRLGQPKGPSAAACVTLRMDSCNYQIASCCGMLPSCHFSPKEVTDWGCLEVPPRFELGSQDSKS